MLTTFYLLARRADQPNDEPELLRADLEQKPEIGQRLPRMSNLERHDWSATKIFEDGEERMLLVWIKRRGWEKVKEAFKYEGLEAFASRI